MSIVNPIELGSIFRCKGELYDDYRCKPFNLDHRYVVVGSGMGTGKTHQMVEIMKKCMLKKKRFLVTSPRRSFAGSVTGRLRKLRLSEDISKIKDLTEHLQFDGVDIQCYLDADETDDVLGHCISAESLHLIKKKYDYIFIDECTSFLVQMCSKYHKSNITQNRQVLDSLLTNAKHVFAMDANIDERILKFLKHFLKPEEYIYTSKNMFKPNKNLTVEYLKSDSQALYVLEKHLIDGKNLQIVLGTESYGTKIIVPLLQRLNINYVFHYSKGDDETDIINDIEKHWAEYQVVMYTSTIGPGLDYSSKHFDYRFSFGDSRTNSVREFNQMRGRVRHLSSNTEYVRHNTRKDKYPTLKQDIQYCISLSINKANSELNKSPSDTVTKILTQNLLTYNTTGENNVWDVDFSNKYIDLYIDNKIEENMSHNDYSDIFFKELCDSGVTIKGCEVTLTTDEHILICNNVKDGYKEAVRELSQSYDTAPICSPEEIKVIASKIENGKASSNDKISIRKTHLYNRLKCEDKDDLMDLGTQRLYEDNKTIIKQAIVERDFTIEGCIAIVDCAHQKSKELADPMFVKYKIVNELIVSLGGTTTRDRKLTLTTDHLKSFVDWFKDPIPDCWLFRAKDAFMPIDPKGKYSPKTPANVLAMFNDILHKWSGTTFRRTNKGKTLSIYKLEEYKANLDLLIDNMQYEGAIHKNIKDLDVDVKLLIKSPLLERYMAYVPKDDECTEIDPELFGLGLKEPEPLPEIEIEIVVEPEPEPLPEIVVETEPIDDLSWCYVNGVFNQHILDKYQTREYYEWALNEHLEAERIRLEKKAEKKANWIKVQELAAAKSIYKQVKNLKV